MQKIKKGDAIVVTAGKDRGRHGTVDFVFGRGTTVLVSGVNIAKKHKRARQETKVQQAGIIDLVKPLPIGNVALICPNCKKKTRVGFIIEGSVKHRQCKQCQGVLT